MNSRAGNTKKLRLLRFYFKYFLWDRNAFSNMYTKIRRNTHKYAYTIMSISMPISNNAITIRRLNFIKSMPYIRVHFRVFLYCTAVDALLYIKKGVLNY